MNNTTQVLCMHRGESTYSYVSYKYEFPGGKVEKNESFEEGMMRELEEEMNINVKVYEKDFFLTVNHEYPDFTMDMHSFLIHVEQRAFDRLEHHNHCWLSIDELHTLDWAPADIPIVDKLIKESPIN
jgi:8-oxo-dGTP diphosphatase